MNVDDNSSREISNLTNEDIKFCFPWDLCSLFIDLFRCLQVFKEEEEINLFIGIFHLEAYFIYGYISLFTGI